MVIPRFFEQAMENKSITVFGSGKQTRDFTHVDDTVKASILLAEKIKGCEIFNIANEHERTILDLAHEIVKVTGSRSEVIYVEAPQKRYDFEVERRFGSSEKLFKTTGYKPDTKLHEGLKGIHKYLLSL